MQQEKQHNVIHMQIQLKLMKNYRKNSKPETGTNVTYNIQGLKLYPGKLKQHMELKEKSFEYNKNNTPQQNWKQMETQIINAIMKTYPYKEKHNRKRQRMDNETSTTESSK